LGNNQDNLQLHRFITSENIAKSLLGCYFFDSHCMTLAIAERFRSVETSP